MDLAEYLYKNKLSQLEFSYRVRIHPNYCSMLVNGVRVPGKALAIRIEKETDGQVTVDELRSAHKVKLEKGPKKCPHCKRPYPRGFRLPSLPSEDTIE